MRFNLMITKQSWLICGWNSWLAHENLHSQPYSSKQVNKKSTQQGTVAKTIEKELESSMASLSNWPIAPAPIIACLLTSRYMKIMKPCFSHSSSVLLLIAQHNYNWYHDHYNEVFTVGLLPMRYIQHQSSHFSGNIQSVLYLLSIYIIFINAKYFSNL